MKTVPIRELHTRTGHYVRRAVTDRVQAAARLVPVSESTGLPAAATNFNLRGIDVIAGT